MAHLAPRRRPLAVLLLLLPALLLGACGEDTGRVTAPGEGSPPAGAEGDGGSGGGGAAAGEIHGLSTFAYKPGPDGVEPVRGGTAVLPLLSAVDSLNPFVSQSADASEIHDLLYPRLWEEQPDYYDGPPSFEPRLADGPPVAGEDGLSLDVTLREAVWSDGKPITAEDVRFSWQAAKNPDVAWVSGSIVDFITDIEVHEPRRLTIHYSERYPYQQMDINDVQILPKHVFGQVPFERWQAHGVWDEQARVSGGPFRLVSIEPETEIVLERNDRWWDPVRPYLDKVVFRVIKDMRTQLTSVLSGDIDVMQNPIPKDAHLVLEAPHLNLYTCVSRAYGYVGWNCDRFPLDDARVRRALTHAIDRENIVDAVYRGYAEVAAPPIISSFWASNPDIEPLPYDPDEAERLIAEAGFERGEDGRWFRDGQELTFTLVTNSVNVLRKQMCEMIQADLEAVGIRCDLALQDPNQLSIQLKQHKFDAYLGAWYVATKVDLKNIWHSSATEGRFNWVNYRNDRVDEIIDTARTMSDFEAARPLWYELQEIIHADQPYTMLYEPRKLDAIHVRFQDVRTTALRTYQNLEDWWVRESDRKYR